MARIFYGADVQFKRGKQGNQVYKQSKTGVYYTAMLPPKVTQPNTEEQTKIKDTFTDATGDWDTLTNDQRAGWDAYGLRRPNQRAKAGGMDNLIGGNGGVMTGLNALVLTRSKLAAAGLAAVSDAPTGEGPTPALNAAGTHDGTKFTITWTEPSRHDVGAKVIIAVDMGSKGASYIPFHKQIAQTALATAMTADITAIKGQHGANVLPTLKVGQTVRFQLQVVNVNGAISAPSATFEVVVA